jgi:hypothetical protein
MSSRLKSLVKLWRAVRGVAGITGLSSIVFIFRKSDKHELVHLAMEDTLGRRLQKKRAMCASIHSRILALLSRRIDDELPWRARYAPKPQNGTGRTFDRNV